MSGDLERFAARVVKGMGPAGVTIVSAARTNRGSPINDAGRHYPASPTS